MEMRKGPGLLNVKQQERTSDRDLLTNQQEEIDDLLGEVRELRRHSERLAYVVIFLGLVVLALSITLIVR